MESIYNVSQTGDTDNTDKSIRDPSITREEIVKYFLVMNEHLYVYCRSRNIKLMYVSNQLWDKNHLRRKYINFYDINADNKFCEVSQLIKEDVICTDALVLKITNMYDLAYDRIAMDPYNDIVIAPVDMINILQYKTTGESVQHFKRRCGRKYHKEIVYTDFVELCLFGDNAKQFCTKCAPSKDYMDWLGIVYHLNIDMHIKYKEFRRGTPYDPSLNDYINDTMGDTLTENN